MSFGFSRERGYNMMKIVEVKYIAIIIWNRWSSSIINGPI